MKVTFSRDSLPLLLRELNPGIADSIRSSQDAEALANGLGRVLSSIDDQSFRHLSGSRMTPEDAINSAIGLASPEAYRAATDAAIDRGFGLDAKVYFGNDRSGLIGGIRPWDVGRAIGLEFGPQGAGNPAMMGLGEIMGRGFPSGLPDATSIYSLSPSVHRPGMNFSASTGRPVPAGQGNPFIGSMQIPGPEAVNAISNRNIASGLVNTINWGATPETIMGSPFPRRAIADPRASYVTADALMSQSPYPSRESAALERLLHDAGYRAAVFKDPAEAAYALHSGLYDMDKMDALRFMGVKKVPLAEGLADILHPPARPYVHYENLARRYQPDTYGNYSGPLIKHANSTQEEIDVLAEILQAVFDRASRSHPQTHPIQTREAALAMLAHAESPHPLKGLPPLVNGLRQVGEFGPHALIPGDFMDAANLPSMSYTEGVVTGLPVRRTMPVQFPIKVPRSIWDPVGLE